MQRVDLKELMGQEAAEAVGQDCAHAASEFAVAVGHQLHPPICVQLCLQPDLRKWTDDLE